MSLDRDAIGRLIPHAGAMCLLETVESWDDVAIVCTTSDYAAASNPLRRNGRLSSVHAIEFAAQAAAVHGALNMPSPSLPRLGLLVSVRHCTFHCASFDGEAGRLRIEARRAAGAASFSTYDFSVSSGRATLVEGRLGVYIDPPDFR